MRNLILKYRHLFWGFAIMLLSSNTAFPIENTLLFNNIKVKDGLPVNEIFSISQDSTGLIWMGTINGIVRYDGYEMTVFRKNGAQTTALPDDQITSLAHDSNLGMWAGSYEGLTWFDTRTNTSELIDLGKPREVRCLLLQSDTLLWVGTSEGLIKLNTRTRSFKLYNQQNSQLGSNIIRALYTDTEQNLWIGTFNGLNSLSTSGNMRFFNLKGKYKPELKNNLILDIQAHNTESDSLLWVGTETGLVLFDRTTGNYTVFNAANSNLGNEVVKCIYPSPDGQLFCGTDFGFYAFDTQTGIFEESLHDPFNNYSLANNVVWDIFEDNAGVVWLATANGISQLASTRTMFRFTPVLNKIGNRQVGNQVNSLYCDQNQTLWLATKSGVIAQQNNGKSTLFNNEKNARFPLVFNNINTISEDHLGRIWIGSAAGINIWDAAQSRMHTITADFNLNRGLRSNYISAFISPADGSFWVGTWGGGLYKAMGNFNHVNEIYFEYVADFNTNIFTSDNKIWIENKNKVFTIDLRTTQIEEEKDINQHITQKKIGSMLISSKGELWIGLSSQLLQYNTQTGEALFHEIIAGEESNINNLLEDQNGDIWGTTLTAVFRFSTTTGQAESFLMSKGIPLDVFLSQSNCRSANGNIYFGGNDGYISFDPSEIQKNLFCPRTIISSIRVNNKPINKPEELKGRNRSNMLVPYSDKIVLSYDQRSVSLTFSALHYGNPHRNLYAYMLEGHDKDWNYTSGLQNLAIYANLPPDKYLFRVKGSNNDGVWFDNETTLQIVVRPPLWASAWAIAFYIVLFQVFFSMVFITYRNKVRFKAEINAITLEKEKNNELVQAKQQFFTNISHEFRTPLNLIIGPVQKLIQTQPPNNENNTLLQLVSRNARRLLSLVNQLMDIRKIETKTLRLNLQPTGLNGLCREQFDLFTDLAQTRKIDYRFEAPEQEQLAITDPEKLESIIQNLLSNAFKFTPSAGQIMLRIAYPEANKISITVIDNGAGIPAGEQPFIFDRFYQGKNNEEKRSGYGIGLNLIKEYCELMGGHIELESQEGKGTLMKIAIPFVLAGTETNQATQTETPNIQTITTPELPAILAKQGDELLPLILLVDDHPDMVAFIRLSLAGNYRFITACNGQEALELLNKHKVDLIISDIMMPGIDGLSLCEKIKANGKLAHIPVIMLTAIAGPGNHIEGFKAGADDYLTKPFNTEVLQARVASLLSRTRKVEEYIRQRLMLGNQSIEAESQSEKLLKETIKYINQHISDPDINIESMSKAIGASHSSLYRKIKDQTGLTLNELIRQVRIKQAARLLQSNKKMTIAEIMDETGFTNHSYFAKCFKKEFGLSPREFMEKNGN